MKHSVVVMSCENMIDAKTGIPTTRWRDHRQPQGYREIELTRKKERKGEKEYGR